MNCNGCKFLKGHSFPYCEHVDVYKPYSTIRLFPVMLGENSASWAKDNRHPVPRPEWCPLDKEEGINFEFFVEDMTMDQAKLLADLIETFIDSHELYLGGSVIKEE